MTSWTKSQESNIDFRMFNQSNTSYKQHKGQKTV